MTDVVGHLFTPQYLPLTVWRNAAFPNDQFQILVDGVVLPLTGQSILMQVRLREDAAEALIDISNVSSGDQILVDDAAQGLFRIKIRQVTHEGLAAANTQNPPNKMIAPFVYDLRIGVAGFERVYAWGEYNVRTGVTR